MFHLNGRSDARLQTMNFGDYSLTRYRKPLADDSLKLFRSVITKGDAVVCFSPPQCIPYDEFRQKHAFDAVTVEPFVDGTMINAFYDGGWKFATKCNVGATNKFYEKTFLEMLNDVELPEMNKNLCYSFVLEHKGCRNVTPVEVNCLVLVASYRIEGETVAETRHLPHVIFRSYDEAVIAANNLPWTAKGYMLVCGADRSKLMSPAFVRASEVKGNDSQFGFRYLQLAQQKILGEYLDRFPERRSEAAAMRQTVESFCEQLFRQYRQRAVTYAFKPHVSALRRYHRAFLSPIPLTRVDVETYVAAMPPAKLMYALNHINR